MFHRRAWRAVALCLLLTGGMSWAQGDPAASARVGGMRLAHAVLLGALEGITEFLPVSSTGHLLVAQKALGLSETPAQKEASDSYAICIQLGAILAVLLVSFGRIGQMARGIVGRDADGARLARNLVIGFVPAVAAGLFLEGPIKRFLFGTWPVAVAWIVGGVALLLIGQRKTDGATRGIEALGWQGALIIGLAQCLALWPGVSRSLATIGAGMLLGLSVPAAVEFSFLLGLVTLGSATIYEGLRQGSAVVAMFGWMAPLVGLATAAVTGFLAVRWMVSYLKRRSPAIFGWYRIGVGVAAVALAVVGVL